MEPRTWTANRRRWPIAGHSSTSCSRSPRSTWWWPWRIGSSKCFVRFLVEKSFCKLCSAKFDSAVSNRNSRLLLLNFFNRLHFLGQMHLLTTTSICSLLSKHQAGYEHGKSAPEQLVDVGENDLQLVRYRHLYLVSGRSGDPDRSWFQSLSAESLDSSRYFRSTSPWRSISARLSTLTANFIVTIDLSLTIALSSTVALSSTGSSVPASQLV